MTTPALIRVGLAGLTAALLLGATPPIASAGDGSFSAAPGRSTYAAGSGVAAIVVADFNNDGRQDLAAANEGDDTVSIRLGDGVGSFDISGPGSPISVGDRPLAIATGDFNKDGNEDFATANFGAGSVSIRLGMGNGGFAAGTTLATGGPQSGPTALAVSDIDNDTDDDIAVTAAFNGNVLIRLGDGAGAFPSAAASSPISTPGHGPYTIAWGDLNNDGHPDLVVGTATPEAPIFLYLGNGAGIFTPAPDSPIPGTIGPDLQLGDFNRDGNEDLAFGSIDATFGVRVKLGDGTGRFTEGAPPFPQNAGPSLALGDFNSDGVEDLATTTGVGNDNLLNVRLGDGAGGFFTPGAGAPAFAGRSVDDAVVGDFNADGNQDIASTDSNQQLLRVLLGGGPPADAGNLLVNGGGEATPGASAARVFGAVTPIPGWSVTGPMTNRRYAAADRYPDRADAARIGGQEAFFSIGATTGTSSATQTVDVSGSSALIDAGNASATLRGYLGGFRREVDTMVATATFKNAAGTSIGNPLQIGPITAADRRNRTTFLQRSAFGAVPASTRSITVTLTGTHGASASQDTAYADRMALLLTDTSAPPGGGGDADTTPPETTITKEPKAKSSKAKAKYRFESSEPNSTFACKLDRKPFKPCDAGKAKYKRLDYGKHKFKVVATDPAGNTDPSAAKDKFKRR